LFDVEGLVALEPPDFVRPRAAIYRTSTDTLLVAGEGDNVLAELDARALDPSLATRRVYSAPTRRPRGCRALARGRGGAHDRA
jgi:hypothetical protein